MSRTVAHVAETLCETCSLSTIMRDKAKNIIAVRCGAGDPPLTIRRHVAECSTYRKADGESMWGMQQIAWIIERDKRHVIIKSPRHIDDETYRAFSSDPPPRKWWQRAMLWMWNPQ